MRVLLWGPLGRPQCWWPCYHRWISGGSWHGKKQWRRKNWKTKIMICGTGLDLLQSSGKSHWSGHQQHLLQWLQALGAQEMQWAQKSLKKKTWLQMYTVPGNCMPLGWQTTEGSPGWTWHAWGDRFLLLPRRHALSSRWLWTLTTTLVKLPGRSSRICYQFSLHATSLPKPLSPLGPMSYLCSLALRIWTSFWRKEDSYDMDMLDAPMVQSRQSLTYRLMESVGLGGPRWHENSWQTGIAKSGSSWLSTLMIDIPGDLVWDLPCVQQARYLEGGPLVWMLPLYLHVNQKSDYDIWYDMTGSCNTLVQILELYLDKEVRCPNI